MNCRGTVKRIQIPPRSYTVKTQHGDVRRYRRHLNPTLVALTYDAVFANVDIPIYLDGGVDEPTREHRPPEPRQRKLPAYLNNVAK